ncbi:MAG: bifunctional methylenetetrahydrofolate dehydrogenase/methenyltetrahydrofolate cyclohydrolase FolD [Myxococcota bacterium]
MPALVIDGKAVAANLRASLKSELDALAAKHQLRPRLVVILASDDPASAVYVRNKGKAAAEIGLTASEERLPSDTPKEKLLARIAELNADPSVDGILVQLPLPKQHDAAEVIRAIAPEKDVDGFHPINAGRLARGDEGGLVSCTPKGVIKLLESAKTPIEGRRAVVLGRSNIVGRPMAELLLNRSATVTVCHSKTRDLPDLIRDAEILIAAIGKADFVKGPWIRPGATVIDVGMNTRPDGKLTGDVAFQSARERARAITPVPGGVGPMTIACLLENTVRAAKLRRGIA